MSDQMTLQALEAAIDKLREDWSVTANDIEIIWGPEEPSAKAMRKCIGDLHRAINPDIF